ncbi:MAG: DUF2155 domain-containing protein [Rickettsiales bacterium]|nr:DUF2155 domain-containing protein [Rickettsiales bacterium]
MSKYTIKNLINYFKKSYPRLELVETKDKILASLGFDTSSSSVQRKLNQQEAIKFLVVILLQAFISLNALAQESEEKKVEQTQNLEVTQIDQADFYSTAVVQALNKVTAKTSILEMKIGNKVDFGKITIVARKCWKSTSDKKPESKILLEVFDNGSGNDDKEKSKNSKRIFYGWMISSSPSISDLEHPIYDITAITCKK